MGFPADKETRELRDKAHKIADSIWRKRILSRTLVYQRVAKEIGIEHEKCHIGMLGFNELKLFIEACEKVKNEELKRIKVAAKKKRGKK